MADLKSTGVSYYEQRATEYDRVYLKPERQDDLRILEVRLDELLAGRSVLEIAAGTGYWTEFFAPNASTVLATDINQSVLDVARRRRAWEPTVDFQVADAGTLATIQGNFDAAFAGFFWSHLLLAELDGFLESLVDRVGQGSRIVFVDNRYVAGSNHPVTRTDTDGNTYQTRTLNDGSSWEVLKNFPTASEVNDRLARFGSVEVTQLTHYWLATLDT